MNPRPRLGAAVFRSPLPTVSMRSKTVRLLATVATLAFIALSDGASGATAPYAGATKDIACDKGSLPESIQGRVSAADITSGRAAKGYTCNARLVSHFGATGGYRVERYADKSGHVCGYYDSTLIFPTDTPAQGTETTGTYVMDLTDPEHPVHTDTLRTPAMQSPHESLRLNQKRGLLAADMANPGFGPAFVDVYDVTADCRHPVLQASSPMGLLGHESGFSPDGNTFWVASLSGNTLAAVDVSNPKMPTLIWLSYTYIAHGVSISNDGNRLYMADNATNALTILDVSQVQKRLSNPTVTIVSRFAWQPVSIPQNATPFTLRGHHYLLETDEYAKVPRNSGPPVVGAARIIDIQNEKHPFLVSNMRLAVNQPAAMVGDQTKDPGANSATNGNLQGYAAHYCTLPSRVNPNVIACSFMQSGLRVFDVRDPYHPQEIAYFNQPPTGGGASNAFAAPAYDEAHGNIWYSDGHSGFYVVHLTKSTGIATFAAKVVLPGN